mgnify:CR=1 FL=1
MKRTAFHITNAQSGVKAIVEKDGIWVIINGNSSKHFFQTNLDDGWFKQPNAYISISGSFLYMIVDGHLILITLTSSKDNIVFADTLDENTTFYDANFSYEETLLYGLTDSNKIIIFSLLPPKKIQEYIFNWDYIATSFALVMLPPSKDFISANAFYVLSNAETNSETQFSYVPTKKQKILGQLEILELLQFFCILYD